MTNTNIDDIIEKVDEDKKILAKCLVEEMKFLKETLAQLKEAIKLLGIVDSSGVQVKESPAMKTYNATMKSYSTCIKQLHAILKTSKSIDATADDLQAFLEASR